MSGQKQRVPILAGLLFAAALAVPAHALNPGKALTQYIHDRWQTEQGLPQNSVFAICQTRDGYLWLGTQEGLVRFDGERFTVFDTGNTPELRHNYVWSLLEDRDGGLWIGTVGGGLHRYAEGRFTSLTMKEGLSNDHIRALCQDASGNLWVGTDDGLDRIAGGRITRFSTRDGLSHSHVRALAADRSGNIWIGTDGGGLNRFRDGAFTVFTTRNGLPHDRVLALHEDRAGRLWAGTQGGLASFSSGAFAPALTAAQGLGSDIVIAVFEDSAGSLWAGTYGGGLSRLSAGKFSSFSTADGLSNVVVGAIFEDREGSLWIGTLGGGLDRLRDAKFTTYTTREGLANDLALSIYEDGRGALWIGTNEGLSRLADGRVTSFTTRDGLWNDLVFSTVEDRDGVLWIGTDGGLNRMQDGRISRWRPPGDELAQIRVRALYLDRGGSLWIGTDGAGALRLRDGVLTRFGTKEGLSNGIVGGILEDSRGDVWIGTEVGLNRLHDGKIATFTTRQGLSSNFILTVYEDAGGNIWAGTFGGLNLYRNGRFVAFTGREGLFSGAVGRIMEDDQGNVWMSCNKGIFRVRRADLDALAAGRSTRVESIWYGTADGMRSAECNGGYQPAGWKTRAGKLWFPTIKGAVVIDPANMPINQLAPPVVLEEVLVDKERLPRPAPARLVIPAGSEKFEFHYTALSLRAPQRVRFKYRLEGFDEEWVDAGGERVAHYTNLSPGRYTFRVIACNDDGLWNETGASLPFHLTPRFYQTLWFYVLCALALGAAATGLHQARIRQLKLRERELSAQVGERTRDLSVANEALQQRNVELASLNSEKNEFLGIVAHDLKNPLGIIGGYAEMMIEEPAMETLERQGYLRRVVHASQRMTELVGNLLDVNAIERGEMKWELGACDLAAAAAQVVDSYRHAAQAKEQTLHYQPPLAPAVAHADPGIAVQICDNLVSNAVKYSPRGARIWVRVAPHDGMVRLEVQDEGPGLSRDDLDRLYGKFARLSARPTGGEDSTGLGLSIVKKMVEAMHGRVWCDSVPGAGATFVVELPAIAARAGEN